MQITIGRSQKNSLKTFIFRGKQEMKPLFTWMIYVRH